MDWKPIEIAGEPKLSGLEDGQPAYRIPLSREPEAEWVRHLNVGRPHGIHPFEVRSKEVIVTPPPSRLRVHVQELRHHVKVANRVTRRMVRRRMRQGRG